MSKKTKTEDATFGALEDEFFQGGGWGEEPDADAEAAKAEEARLAAAKAEEAKLAAAKAAAEAAKLEMAKAEAAKAEAAKAEKEKIEAAKAEAAKAEAAKAEAAKAEAAKAEAAKAEAAKIEAARVAAEDEAARQASREQSDVFKKKSAKEKADAKKAEEQRRQEEAAIAAAEEAENARLQAEADAARNAEAEAQRVAGIASEAQRSADRAAAEEAAREAAEDAAREAAAAAAAEVAAENAGRAEALVMEPVRRRRPNPTLVFDPTELLAQLGTVEDAETQMEPGLAAIMENQPEPEPAAVVVPQAPLASGEGSWTEALALLRREAERASGARRIVLCTAAAHFARTRLNAASDALVLLDLAGVSTRTRGEGRGDAAYWLERARALEALGERGAAAAAYEALGAVSPNAAESEVEAAKLHVATGADDAVGAALGRALAAGEDPGALSLLAEVQRRRSDPALPETLSRLAALQVGPIAAGLMVERAMLLARTSQSAAAWRAARASDPANAAALAGFEAALRESGDWQGLAGLYEEEARRVQDDPTLQEPLRRAEAAWWWARAARVLRGQVFRNDEATRCFIAAVQASPHAAGLRHELQAHLAESGDRKGLVEALREEAAALTGPSRAFALFRLARELESSDWKAACDVYMQAAEEPAAAPAAEAALRLLHKAGRWAETVEFLVRRASCLEDPSLLVTLWYRAGETAEGPLRDLKGARTYYEKVLELAPSYIPVLEALERVYHRLGAWAELAAVYEQRSLLAEEPSGAALQRHRAGATYEIRLQNTARAKESYRMALSSVPDFSPSVDAYARLLETDGEWVELGRVLRAAAASTRDAMESVSMYYRAGRVLADHSTDTDGARACLRKALEASPGFLPAVLLLKDLAAHSGDIGELLALERGQADMGEDVDRRHWRLLAAAEFARGDGQDPDGHATAVLREGADGAAKAAALEVLERSALRSGDASALAKLYGDAGDWVRLAEVAVEAGESAELSRAVTGLLADGRAAPLRTLARSVEAAGNAPLAAEAIRAGALLATVDAVRLGIADRVFEALPGRADPALAQAAMRLRAGPAETASAHQALAVAAVTPGVRANHARQAAALFRYAGQMEACRTAWEMALEAQPSSRSAFEGLRGALIALKDAEGLRAIYGRLTEDHRSGLGEALEEAGDLAGATDCFRAETATASEMLPWSLRLERLLVKAEDWKGVLDVLNARQPRLAEDLRGEGAARSRWILAEKLAGSEEAWDYYRKLHADDPSDREVLEALARIAGARGETVQAVFYLEDLARTAANPTEAARYQRRTADALEASGNMEGARTAFARALDLDPKDGEALLGLRRLGEAAGDWEAVVRVVERTAALAAGTERVGLYAEVARIYEEKVKNRALASDAWRKVLDLAPDHQEALRRLLGLCEQARDWNGFVQVAQALLPFVEGEDRSALQRRIGVVFHENMRRDDDAIRFLDAATSGVVVDPDAAGLLERIYANRGDWDRAVDALERVARSGAPHATRVDALARAARLRLEMNRDRPGAAAIFDRLLQLDPDHHEALRFRGEHLFEAGQFAEAADVYERLEPIESKRDVEDFDEQVDVAMFFYRSAEALRRSGRGPEAMARYQRALELNPTHLPSLEAIGPMYTETAQWQKADKVFKQVLQLTGGHGNNEQLASVYANLGIVELHLGQPEKARKRFSKALELRANEVPALRGLARVLFQANDWNNLLNIYNNIIYHTQDPADVVAAYVAKGFVLDARLHLPDKAAQHFEKGLAFDGNQPVTLLRLGELALRRQDWPEAATISERGLVIAPLGSPVRGCLMLVKAIAFQACGDATAGNEMWAEACAQHDSVAQMLAGTTISSPDEAHSRLRQRLQADLTFA